MSEMRSNAVRALQVNRMVRQTSGEKQLKTVHWEFFNQVYDALEGILREESAYKQKYNRLMEWADKAGEYILIHGGPHADELGLQLQVIRREMEE